MFLVGKIDGERISVGTTGFVARERDDWLMQASGINRGDRPSFLRVQLHGAVDWVDADEFNEQGNETTVETAEFSLLE